MKMTWILWVLQAQAVEKSRTVTWMLPLMRSATMMVSAFSVCLLFFLLISFPTISILYLLIYLTILIITSFCYCVTQLNFILFFLLKIPFIVASLF